jgi:peptidoglycan/LPS O-acetylase OafA/YrhL
MLPVMQGIIIWLHPASPALLFVETVAITMPLVYAVAWLLHLTIERPGIQLGRRLLGSARRIPAESGAA